MDDNGITVLNVYRSALERVKSGGIVDYKDVVIVKMWNESLKKQETIEGLKKQLSQQDKTIREQAHALEIFHSRDSVKLCGQSGVGAYLNGLLDSSQILTH